MHRGVLRQFALLGERGLGVQLALSALVAVAPPNNHMDTRKTYLLDLLHPTSSLELGLVSLVPRIVDAPYVPHSSLTLTGAH